MPGRSMIMTNTIFHFDDFNLHSLNRSITLYDDLGLEHRSNLVLEKHGNGTSMAYVLVVQLLSHVQLFVTPWTAAHQASLSFTISRNLLKLMSSELMMPSNHLILCRQLFLLPSVFPSIRVFSNELALHIRWPEYWSFSFTISPSNECSGLISFRIDWFDLLADKRLLGVFSSTTAREYQFFRAQPSLWSLLSAVFSS